MVDVENAGCGVDEALDVVREVEMTVELAGKVDGLGLVVDFVVEFKGVVVSTEVMVELE